MKLVSKADESRVLTQEELLDLDRLLFGLSCHTWDENGRVVRVPLERVKYRRDDGVYEVKP